MEQSKKLKVIVFGGAGFLGSHVADLLSERGHQVVIFDLKKSPYLKEGQVSIIGDITDKTAVEKAVRGSQIVYNFAALADMEEAGLLPLETIKVNILGNSNILEACRKNKVERFVFASTLYVYSKKGSFYRSSKQASELLIENYHDLCGLNYTILRYGSLYGPRAGKENAVYRMLSQALREGKITRCGNGEETREYIHVYDAARLSCDILAEEYKNQAVIITGEQPMKVKDILLTIKEILDNKIELEFLPHTDSMHYNITPYNFIPKLAARMRSTHYVDLGQGLLDLMNQAYLAKVKAVIFDFDGVISESVDVKTRAFGFLFKDCKAELPAILALHQTHGGLSRFEKFERIYRDILKQPLSQEKKQELGSQFSQLVYQGVLDSPFVAGAKEFLEKYHDKVPLFIASGTPDEEIKSLARERGLERYFKGIFGSPAKKSEIILNILKEFHFQPQEVIFVGDSVDDEEGARGAGVKFIWQTKENNAYENLNNNFVF